MDEGTSAWEAGPVLIWVNRIISFRKHAETRRGILVKILEWHQKVVFPFSHLVPEPLWATMQSEYSVADLKERYYISKERREGYPMLKRRFIEMNK